MDAVWYAAVPIAGAFVGGFLPAMVWLWFFHKEDRHPEPKAIVALAFVAGVAAVAPALLLERAILPFTEQEGAAGITGFSPTAATLLAWAIIEEALKWFLVWALVLWRKAVDEPLDIPLYLITSALGFAAAENMLFLWGPFTEGMGGVAVLHGSLRFIGATLLHVTTSGILGILLAASAYKPRPLRRLWILGGFAAAVGAHLSFNLALLHLSWIPPVVVFAAVWFLIVSLLAGLEYTKRSPLINRSWHFRKRKPVVYL
ncbi:MAG: hypothetical protein KatS3mg099_086 [Candidatus Parcubacteria bacterium]|nr:MAG: hypothetical protein KatS3mg099_086 [Candidatus Parcubacteria bacterium]